MASLPITSLSHPQSLHLSISPSYGTDHELSQVMPTRSSSLQFSRCPKLNSTTKPLQRRQVTSEPLHPQISGLTNLQLKCTTRAVQERLKKLRKLAQTGAETSTAGKSSPKTPSKAPRQKPTPPTKSRKTPSKPSSGGKGKKAAKDKAIADDSGMNTIACSNVSG